MIVRETILHIIGSLAAFYNLGIEHAIFPPSPTGNYKGNSIIISTVLENFNVGLIVIV